MSLSFPTRRRLFHIATLSAIASVLLSLAIRSLMVSADVQYMPKEDSLLVASGDIASLWEGLETQLGPIIRDQESQGFISGRFAELLDYLDRSGLEIEEPADLREHGIDIERSVLMSLEITDVQSFVLLVHVWDHERFDELVSKLSGTVLGDAVELRLSATTVQARAFDEYYLVYPEPDIALVSNSLLSLDRSLSNRTANLDYFRGNDRFYEAVHRLLGRPAGVGPAVFASFQLDGARVRAATANQIREITSVFEFGDRAVNVRGSVELADFQLSLLDRFLKASPRRAEWMRLLPYETAAVVMLQDDAIASYLEFFGAFQAAREIMALNYGGLLWELRRASSLHRAVLSVPGYRDGLPDFTLGLWGEPNELAGILQDFQISSRSKRDEEVLREALYQFSLDHEPGGESPTLSALVDHGYLQAESEPFFDRYEIANGEVVPGELRAADFETASYRKELGDHTIRFLTPRLNENDLRYRGLLEGEDRDSLLDDRYRLAYAVNEGVVWITTDVRSLEAQLADGHGASLADNLRIRAASASWNGSEKIQLVLNVDEIISLGLLSPESRINDWIKDNFFDFRNHPVISFEIATGGRNRLEYSLEMVARQWLLQ